MPGLSGKGKGSKGANARASRSRHSTPGSVASLPLSAVSAGNTALLELNVAHLSIPTNVLYDDLLDRHGAGTGLPESRHLRSLIDDLKTLSALATEREKVCDRAIRELSSRLSSREAFDRETETLNRDAQEKARFKRAAEADDGKEGRSKRRREHKVMKEDRPLAVGAHDIANQDGTDLIPQPMSTGRSKADSGSSSPLSPPSQLQSPVADTNSVNPLPSARPQSSSSSSSDTSRQPPPASTIPQYQTFGSNPLSFDDPTVYHIRDVDAGMSDADRRDVYCVAVFPQSDLKDLTAGEPPDKDFSNAKPSNQVAATTFATYLDPYLRAFGDEDVVFLKERGDRGDIFTVNARGARHYKDAWAEEDGQMSLGRDGGKLPLHQPRGSLDRMNDDTAATDQVSMGPLTERVLALMKSERRVPAEDKDVDGAQVEASVTETGDTTLHNEEIEASASYFPELGRTEWKVPTAKVDYAGMEERLKQELQYIGIFSSDDEQAYEGHWDDEVAERIRVLQTELRRISVENGARKALLLEKVKESMAYQEYQTIQDDLDQQIVQAFLKRNRTMNKPNKNKKRPGNVVPPTNVSSGIGKLGIGDVARTLIDRRRRWMDTLQGIFDEDFTKIKSEGENLFTRETMKEKMKSEEENWDDDAEVVS